MNENTYCSSRSHLMVSILMCSGIESHDWIGDEPFDLKSNFNQSYAKVTSQKALLISVNFCHLLLCKKVFLARTVSNSWLRPCVLACKQLIKFSQKFSFSSLFCAKNLQYCWFCIRFCYQISILYINFVSSNPKFPFCNRILFYVALPKICNKWIHAKILRKTTYK